MVITANIYDLISACQCLGVVQLAYSLWFQRLQSRCHLWLQSPLRLGVLFLAVGRIEFLAAVGLRSLASGDSTVVCPVTLSRPCSVIFLRLKGEWVSFLWPLTPCPLLKDSPD